MIAGQRNEGDEPGRLAGWSGGMRTAEEGMNTLVGEPSFGIRNDTTKGRKNPPVNFPVDLSDRVDLPAKQPAQRVGHFPYSFPWE